MTDITKVILSLGGVLFLAYATTRFVGTSMVGGGRGRALRVIDTCILGKDRAIYLVVVGDRAMVVGSSGGGLSPLMELSKEETREILREMDEAMERGIQRAGFDSIPYLFAKRMEKKGEEGGNQSQ